MDRYPMAAVLETTSFLFSPKAFDKTALTPIPVPIATATNNICSGKAYPKAVMAKLFLGASIMPIKIESTMLYKADITIEKIIGKAIFSNKLQTGDTPILLVCSFSINKTLANTVEICL